ncbi:MAG TPA: FtsX-like permease family protein, partial [Clostridia bacterium]|nr:FtsX-like permease family protein [Clostridia bacterium]
GSLLGIAFAVVIFKLLLQWTLGSAITFPISFWKLIVSMAVGMIVTMLAGSIPMFLARRRSVRENLLATLKENNKQKLALFIFMSILLAVCLFFEFTIETATAGVYALIAFIVIILMVVMFSPMFLTLFEKITRHSQKCNKSLRIATLNLSRVQSSRRGVQILALGLTVSVMLFVAWNMTTTMYTALTSQFSEMILVSNVPVDNNLKSEMEEVLGVRSVVPAIWKQVQLEIDGEHKSITVLGAKEILNHIDFEYITDETETKDILAAGLNTDERYAFLDYAYTVLYGVKVGDHINLKLEDKTAQFVVGGILKSELFTGNYAVISREQMSDAFVLPSFDTIMLFADNTEKTEGVLRTTFADRNFFIIGALESFRYEVDSFSSVFDLIGMLAYIIAGMVLISIISNTVVSRSARYKERGQYLVAGMSKKTLFSIEVLEHILIAVVAAVLAFGLSTLLTICLIDTLLLFGVYLNYSFAILPALWVTVAISLAYIIMPFVGNYKKNYTLQTRE